MDPRTKVMRTIRKRTTEKLALEMGRNPEDVIRTEGGVDYQSAEQAERSQDELFWIARVLKWTAYAGLIVTAGLIGFALGKGI